MKSTQINDKKESEIDQLQYVMIINDKVFESLMKLQQAGKKLLMSLAISYFEQRFQNDYNPLLRIYDPNLHNKLAFYCVEKMSIELNIERKYFYNNK